MARSKISYNIHAQVIKDASRLKQHLLKINPTVVLFLDGLGAAKETKAALPNTIVIHRNYGVTNGDDDVHVKITPQRWMELRAKESEGDIYLYTTNEPAFDQKCIQWHVELMELAAKQGVKLVIGNWAVGNPGADDWGQAKRMLELLDQHRDLFILGLHEYACGIVTSGLYGGFPNNAGVQPGTPGGQDLVPKDKWPKDVSKITMWHCGRFHFLLNYCAKNNIKPPRVILTEHGMDDVSDIKGWAERLDKTPNYSSIRGWKSLKTQWDKWFNPVGWSAERGYFEQLSWADQVIYHNSVVEGQCIFSWGHTSDVWEQFDVAEATEFQKLLEAYAAQGGDAQVGTTAAPTPAPVVTQVVVTKPVVTQPVATPVQSMVAPSTTVVSATAAVATQPITTTNGQHQISVTDDDIKVINTGLTALGKIFSDPTISAALQRLSDVLARAKS